MDLLKITFSYVYGLELFTGCINSMTVYEIFTVDFPNKDGDHREEAVHHWREPRGCRSTMSTIWKHKLKITGWNVEDTLKIPMIILVAHALLRIWLQFWRVIQAAIGDHPVSPLLPKTAL